MADDSENTDASQGAASTPRPFDGRGSQRNFAERLFPGPSPEMSDQVRRRVENLIKERGRTPRRNGAGSHASGPSGQGTPAIGQPWTSEADLVQLHEALDQQTELLKAILSSSVDTQADSRSTAQNSRTFAWAGTAIALLTLIATVISIVAVVQAH